MRQRLWSAEADSAAPRLHSSLFVEDIFMWLFDSNSPKIANGHEKKKKKKDRQVLFSMFPNSVNHQLATVQSPTTHRVLDGASLSFETVDGEVYCRTPQHFRKNLPPTRPVLLLPSHVGSPTPQRHQDRCLISIAQPIFQEDGDWNVTNPSVPVWISMLIWSNSPSGDSAREQFNHDIYDSCFPAFSVIWEYMHVPPG